MTEEVIGTDGFTHSVQVQPFNGQVVGRRITVSFDYEIVTRKHYVVDLDKNDSIW